MGFCDRCARLGRQCKLVDGKCTMIQEDIPATTVNLKELNVGATVKLNAYRIIDDTIESAIRYGYSRSFKHTDKPTKEHIVQEIHRSVMNDLCNIHQI
jgi:hypothetical protein